MSVSFFAVKTPPGRSPRTRFWSRALLAVLVLSFASKSFCLGCQVKPPELSGGTPDKKNSAQTIESSKKSDQEIPSQSTASDAVLTYSDPVTVKWKVGVKVLAGPTDALNLYIAIPVPCDWPEQTVTVFEEDMPPSVGNVAYAVLDGSVRRQLIRIPVLKAGEQLNLTTIFRVSTCQVTGPSATTGFVKPDKKIKENTSFLAKSRYISFENSKLRIQAATLAKDEKEAWKQIEAVYDWVRENIDQKEMPNTDSVKTFRQKVGSEEDKVALFVAMCRSLEYPSRMVWVDGGCYAEFMLADATGKLYWFPCNVTGVREFGSLAEPRIILQKGDNIKVPEKNVRQKFVAEHLSCQGTTRPAVDFVRELLPDE